jgi:serine protease AprX
MANKRVNLPHLKIAPALQVAMGQSEVAPPSPASRETIARPRETETGPPQGLAPAPAAPPERLNIIIAVKADPSDPQGGVPASRERLKAKLQEILPGRTIGETDFFLQCEASPSEIQMISKLPGVDMVWPNPDIQAHLLVSVETVRASAGWRTFEARGKGVTWAVLDTGINVKHPQFATLKTVDEQLSKSFVAGDPLTDPNGHGTHVAGIIAGAASSAGPGQNYTSTRFDHQTLQPISEPLDGFPAGMAPFTRLISVQVLNKTGGGSTFDCIRGLAYLRSLNQGSRERCVDGANLSLGYDLEASTYGCGFSPICEEVNRAVDAGICVVVSCGNSGYGVAQSEQQGVSVPTHVGMAQSISDPANADQCISVGSVHKREPHKYGVSYFSSKGPTVDGRQKPDLVAPGERIISCNAAYDAAANPPTDAYCEMSGTSMAAPHVSGAIASFLSVRPDFRGNPREIKRIFKASAMDLGRDPAYQGAGMVDAFRALTSV